MNIYNKIHGVHSKHANCGPLDIKDNLSFLRLETNSKISTIIEASVRKWIHSDIDLLPDKYSIPESPQQLIMLD